MSLSWKASPLGKSHSMVCSRKFGVVGPYFFENEEGKWVTVTSYHYCLDATTISAEELRRRHIDRHQIWFQQMGPLPIQQGTMRILRQMFLGDLIFHFSDFNWPARSPDFFLWSFLKTKAYREQTYRIQELKDKIITEIQQIPQDIQQRVMDSIRCCTEICVRSGGAHLTEVIFKKWT